MNTACTTHGAVTRPRMTPMALQMLVELFRLGDVSVVTAVDRSAMNILIRLELVRSWDGAGCRYIITQEGTDFVEACLKLPTRSPAMALKPEVKEEEPTFTWAYGVEAQVPLKASAAYRAQLETTNWDASQRAMCASLFEAFPIEWKRHVLNNLGWREQL